MKTRIICLTTTCAALFAATLANAQFRPIDPVPINPMPMPINPRPITPLTPIEPINPGPITPFTPSNSEPIEPSGPSGGNPPAATLGQTFVIAVCAGSSDVSDECLDRGTAEAVRRLSQLYLEEYAKKVVEKSLAVRFPDAMTETEQLKFLTTVEKAAVSIAVAKMQADIAKLTPFQWDTAQERSSKQAVVDNEARKVTQWNEKARSEANNGSNWSHNWPSNSHTFHEGNAYRQLKQISISGWGGT